MRHEGFDLSTIHIGGQRPAGEAAPVSGLLTADGTPYVAQRAQVTLGSSTGRGTGPAVRLPGLDSLDSIRVGVSPTDVRVPHVPTAFVETAEPEVESEPVVPPFNFGPPSSDPDTHMDFDDFRPRPPQPVPAHLTAPRPQSQEIAVVPETTQLREETAVLVATIKGRLSYVGEQWKDNVHTKGVEVSVIKQNAEEAIRTILAMVSDAEERLGLEKTAADKVYGMIDVANGLLDAELSAIQLRADAQEEANETEVHARVALKGTERVLSDNIENKGGAHENLSGILASRRKLNILVQTLSHLHDHIGDAASFKTTGEPEVDAKIRKIFAALDAEYGKDWPLHARGNRSIESMFEARIESAQEELSKLTQPLTEARRINVAAIADHKAAEEIHADHSSAHQRTLDELLQARFATNKAVVSLREVVKSDDVAAIPEPPKETISAVVAEKWRGRALLTLDDDGELVPAERALPAATVPEERHMIEANPVAPAPELEPHGVIKAIRGFGLRRKRHESIAKRPPRTQ